MEDQVVDICPASENDGDVTAAGDHHNHGVLPDIHSAGGSASGDQHQGVQNHPHWKSWQLSSKTLLHLPTLMTE